MATTTNYGWTTPDNSGLVKNGAQDIRTLGSAIDTSLANVGYGNAGKNKIINGAFDIWQRGTSSFTNGGLTADRWYYYADGTGTRAVTQQTFTPGTAPVSGYEGQYFWRMTQSVAGTGASLNITWQRIEDVRTFAGQTVTMSFWAKADAARTISVGLNQNFGSGGSTAVSITGTSFSVTTSWQRFSYTVAIPSIAGKTIGTSSYFETQIGMPLNVVQTIDIWGVQLEAGSTATPFSRNASTIQGELAACQRYYYQTGGAVGVNPGNGHYYTSTGAYITTIFPVTMRTAPAQSITNAGSWSINSAGTGRAVSSFSASTTSTISSTNLFTTAAATAGNGGWLESTNPNAALSFSSEL